MPLYCPTCGRERQKQWRLSLDLIARSPQMPFADDQNMIQALTPKRSDQALSVWVLPRRPRWYGSVTNPHRSNSALKGLPVGTIIVAHQIGGRRVPRECLCHLLSQPLGRRIAGHRKPQQLPPAVTQNKKGKQPLEGQGWDHARIDRRNRRR